MESSRIANVTAAVLVGFGDAAARKPRPSRIGSLAPLLSQLFEETLWVGDGRSTGAVGRPVLRPGNRRDGVSGIAAAIAAARGERVIVIDEGDALASAELLLALVAWPEAAIVLPLSGEAADTVCPRGIYRCDALRARAEEQLEGRAPTSDFETFVAGLEVVRVPVATLGLSDAPIPLFAGPRVRPRSLD